MKKYFINIGIFSLLISFVPFLSRAATNEDFVGKDLYERIEQKVRTEPEELAIHRTLENRNLSKEELYFLIPGSQIGGLLTKPEPKANLTPKQVEERRQELKRFFEEERELAQLEILTKMEVEPTEIFANGDESDSGFDLLVDLDIIEKILFGKTETVFGGTPSSVRRGARVIGPTVGQTPAGSPQPSPTPSIQPPSAGVPLISSQRAGLEAARVQPTPGAVGESLLEQVRCPLNSSFHEAVLRMKRTQATQERARDQRRPEVGEQVSSSSRALQAGTTAERTPSSGAAGALAPEASITPEAPADWSRPLPCDGIFCLKIDAVYKKRSSYLANENCIACHFEKINDAFQKTFSHTLLPSKVTGNLIETPKCKRALGASLLGIDLRLLLLSQPILTPPNDDLVVKGDFIKNMISFYEKYLDNPGRCQQKGSSEIRCKPDPVPEKKIPEQVIQTAPSGTTQEKILEEIRKQVAIEREKAAEVVKQTRLESDSKNLAEQFQVIEAEIDTMNAYFESFAKIYAQLSSPQKDSPCTLLINKEMCS